MLSLKSFSISAALSLTLKISSIKTMLFSLAMYERKETSLTSLSFAGYTVMAATFSMDLCELISKLLIESIISSHSSIRMGKLSVTGYMSMIPPLTLNCPLASMVYTLS